MRGVKGKAQSARYLGSVSFRSNLEQHSLCTSLCPAGSLPGPPTAMQEAPVVVVGADDGAVAVYSLAGLYDSMNSGPAHEEGQRQRLEAALRHHTAQATSD